MQPQTLLLREVCSIPAGFLFKDELITLMQRAGDKANRNIYLTRDVAGGKPIYRLFTDYANEVDEVPLLRVVIDVEDFGGTPMKRYDGIYMPYEYGEFLIYSAGDFFALRKEEDGDLFCDLKTIRFFETDGNLSSDTEV